MKLLSNRFFPFFLTLLLCLTLLPLDSALARGGRGGGGRGGGGASARTSSRSSLQNRGSLNSSRGTQQRSSSQNRQANRGQAQQTRQGNQQARQTNRDQAAQTRQGNQQTRQTNRDQAAQTRQGNQQERQSNRQDNQQNRQNTIQDNQQNRQDAMRENQQNRQNFIDDNYDGGWYGGGWYGGGYYAPVGWGAWAAAVGLAAGVAIGATVDSPPPYYSTVYVDNDPYIYSDGVYLEPQGSSYVVVAPPTGAVVTYLPDGCTVTQMNGTQYYDCSGIYYQTVYQNGATVYQVVKF